jgi:hypothetical protein
MLLFNRIIDSFQSLHIIWTVSHFMACVGHKFLEDVQKIPYNYQVRTTDSCATVRTSL